MMQIEIALDSAKLYFLRQRYGKRKQPAALLKMAMLEVVSMQAEKELKEAEAKLTPAKTLAEVSE